MRNDTYGAGPKANLDAVELTITPPDTGALTEYNGFNNGQFDWARMPVPVQAQARAANEPKNQWISKKTAGINYLQVQVQQPPLNSVAARKAISMAIDRDAIAQGVFQGSQVPGHRVPARVVHRGLPGRRLRRVPIRPRQGQGARRAGRADRRHAGRVPVQQRLEATTSGRPRSSSSSSRTSGVAVDYSGVPFRDLLTNQRQPTATGLFRAGWSADYPTPSNFLASLLTTKAIGAATPDDVANGDNRGRYSNPVFDELVAQAVATPDVAARNDLYKQAEKIAIGDDLV